MKKMRKKWSVNILGRPLPGFLCSSPVSACRFFHSRTVLGHQPVILAIFLMPIPDRNPIRNWPLSSALVFFFASRRWFRGLSRANFFLPLAFGPGFFSIPTNGGEVKPILCRLFISNCKEVWLITLWEDNCIITRSLLLVHFVIFYNTTTLALTVIFFSFFSLFFIHKWCNVVKWWIFSLI